MSGFCKYEGCRCFAVRPSAKEWDEVSYCYSHSPTREMEFANSPSMDPKENKRRFWFLAFRSEKVQEKSDVNAMLRKYFDGARQ